MASGSASDEMTLPCFDGQSDFKKRGHYRQKLKRSRSLEFSSGGHTMFLHKPEELLKQAQSLYREELFEMCISKLTECQESPIWEEPS